MCRMIIIWLSVASLLGIIFVVVPQLIYPVRIEFSFDYNGRHYDPSFLTVMRIRICGFEECAWFAWNHGRDKVSLPLPDGSLLVLRPDWPWSSFNFRSGVKYSPPVGWAWLNNRLAPTQIVSGGSASRLSPDRLTPLPFPRFAVSATMERASWLSLQAAIAADRRPDDVDRILGSSDFGGPWNVEGQFFAGIEVQPLQGDGLSNLRQASGWIDLEGGCRILVRSPGDAKLNPNGIVSDYLKRRVLLRHDDLWSADGAPAPSEVTVRYSAGSLRLQPTGRVPDLVRPILQKLQRLEFNGKECRGIKLPNDSYGAYIDLDGIGMIVVGPSLSWMVLGEPPKF